MYKLVLLRHGESQWNLENRFTGWTDVDLTEKGESEARLSGQLLKKEGFILFHLKIVCHLKICTYYCICSLDFCDQSCSMF